MDTRQLIAELKTRGVYRVAAFYCAGAWALLQVADLFSPMLGLPDSSVTMVLVAAVIGFPFALLLSWLFDITPEGVVTAPRGNQPVQRVQLSVPHLLELGLILGLIISVGYLYLDRLTEEEAASREAVIAGADNGRPSIAVMPFLNLGDDRDIRYLGDGLAEEILNLLARLSELNVAARSSSFFFRDKQHDLESIAERLEVGHILEGSVRRDGGRIRVTAQLIEVASGYQVWSDAYDGDLGSLLELQENIAKKVVEALQLVLSSQSREVLSRGYPVDPVAYDYYLRGRDYLRRQMDESNLDAAVSFFRKALAVDEGFADAWAGLCDSLLGLYEVSRSARVFEEGERACRQALALDSEAVPVYIALGNLYRVSGKYQQALEAFDHALELQPTAIDAFRGRGKTYASLNRPEKVEQNLQAAIDLQPNYWGAQNDLGAWYFQSGHFDRAIPYFQRVATLNPGSETAFNNLGSAYYMAGLPVLASEAWEQSVALAPSAISLSNLGSSLFYAGEFEKAAQKYELAVRLAPENFEYWGNLGEALRFVDDAGARSREVFTRAIELGEAQLAINPADSRARAMVASYLARAGQGQEARSLLADSLESQERGMQEYYFRAVSFIALGESEQALTALEGAVAGGYPGPLLTMDRNFTDLRQQSRFTALVGDSLRVAGATTPMKAKKKEANDEKQ